MTKEDDIIKQLLANFGRLFALLFNRSFMYSANHPFQIETIDSTYAFLTQLLQNISPTVFIMNGEKFYVDEEPLDPRLSVSKILFYFKRTGIESISFYRGIEKKDLQLFLEVVTSLDKYPDAEAMSRAMFKKQINCIKLNHVFYKKVSAEDEVISRDVLDKVTPEMMNEQQDRVKQMFMDSVFSSVLQEEFLSKLTLDNLLKNPDNLPGDMISADLTTVNQYKDNNLNEEEKDLPLPGQFLLHQLEMIDQDVERNLAEGTGMDLPKIADALFDMRQKLIEGIEAQKALGIAYANEEEVYSKAAEITDKVLIRLIKDEYKKGQMSVSRMAQILCRLIPEANELKRLLPKIKTALLEEGMSQADFMSLIQELGRELQSDSLAKILTESAEEIGVDGSDIIQQVKENPLQSAEMIYLASEIRKGGGSEKDLTDLLVNYVEQVGSKYSKSLTGKPVEEGEKHIRNALMEVKSNLVQNLSNLEIKDDLLDRLEERVNQRMDDIFNKLRSEWINTYSSSQKHEPQKVFTVLETLERGVSEDDDLGQILKIIRKKVKSGEIDENDFDQIYPEIAKQEQLQKSSSEQKGLYSGVMKEQTLMTYLDKEIARSKRYKTPIAALGFTLVKLRAKANSKQNKISKRAVFDTLLHKLVEIFRDPDIIGEIQKNYFMVLLPMTHQGDAKLALRRAMKILHLNPLDVGGVALEIKVAGVVAEFEMNETANAEGLVDCLKMQIKDMATRIGNLHAYS